MHLKVGVEGEERTRETCRGSERDRRIGICQKEQEKIVGGVRVKNVRERKRCLLGVR